MSARPTEHARIAILTDDPGWHGAQLREAFRAQGVEACFASLRDCRFDLHRSGRHVVIPGFEEHLPQGVFVRAVPGGTLEQVVLRLDILHALKLLGVPVYNDGRAIERTVDKAMTSFVLARAGVATPPTWVTESQDEAADLVCREIAAGHELVLKPLFGSQGVGLRRLSVPDALPPAAEYDGVYYLQHYVESAASGWHDYRVFVIGGRAVAAMKRQGRSWITNVSQGGICEAIEPGDCDDVIALACTACHALQMDYAGVDLIRDRAGQAQVIEVNGIPAWKGLQSVTPARIAQCLAEDFLNRYVRRPALQSVA